MQKMKEKTEFDYQTLISKTKPALVNCIKNHVRMTMESTSGFNALNGAVDDSCPFLANSVLEAILDAVTIRFGTVRETGLGQLFIKVNHHRLNAIVQRIPNRIWVLTQKRFPDTEPKLGFLSDILKMKSDLNCICSVDWSISKFNSIRFESEGFRVAECEYLQEVITTALEFASDLWAKADSGATK